MITVTCRTCGAKVEGLLDYENHARTHDPHEPVVSKSTSRHCGRCGVAIMFDPDTLKPWHVPAVPA